MLYQSVIGKMHEYLLATSGGLARWLDSHLPKSNDWWNVLVLSKLSDNQRINCERDGASLLTDLDLSALLRVADKNWYLISQKFFLNYSERDRLKSMFSIRNRWSHYTADAKENEQIIADIELLSDFCSQIDIDKSTMKEMLAFRNVIQTEGVTYSAEVLPQKPTAPLEAVTLPTEISVGSTVHLKSNIKKIGIVTAISKIGDTDKYGVFIGEAIEVLYADQIELHEQPVKPELTSIEDLRRILTSRQIAKPSNEYLYSLNSARIDFVPYQFRPALKLIKSETPRLLIADSVGVGKTIEAGLILKEMQARSSIDTVVVICPKPLVAERKWELEMREKFGEDFVPADNKLLRQIILNYELDGVWDERYRHLIIPYSILSSDLLEGVQGKRSHPGLNSLNPPPVFDMLIVDEAHHIRNSETQTHRATKFFCDHSGAVLFLTATPIQLGSQDLYTLLHVLFPEVVISRASFEAMAEPNIYVNKAIKYLRAGANRSDEALAALKDVAMTEWGRNVVVPNPIYTNALSVLSRGELDREQRVSLINDVESLHSFSHMINRTRRQDIGDFCVRRPYTMESHFTEQQQELHDELLDFEHEVLSILHGNVSAKFLMSTISRQAASCLFGLAPFVNDLTAKRMSELFEEYDEDWDEPDVDIGLIREKAKRLVALAENLPIDDPKFDTLAGILQNRHDFAEGKAIVFSSFRHTLNYLYKRISNELRLRTAQVNGSIPDDERFRLRQCFALPKENPEAIDVLLFTEIGSEGLDYQFCNTMINYDLPWNPMRIEQRIGRIDRRGQMNPSVLIYNCIVAGTIDAEIYQRCFLRIGIFEQSLGECSDILGNIETSIKNIVFDSALTKEERIKKFEQMSDNEIRQINENRKLEEEGKEMFGVDVAGFNDDIDRADNVWVFPNDIQRLVIGYLEKRLGYEKKHIADGKLNLSFNEKQILLDDYNEIKDRSSDKVWEAYLASGKNAFQISFSQVEAKNNRKCLFITTAHPITRQAAEHYANSRDIRISLNISSGELPIGEYPFLLYSWEYTGAKPRVELVVICDNDSVRNELPILIQSMTSSQSSTSGFPTDWSKLEEMHFSKWRQEKESFVAEVQANCRFKVESLKKSLEARKLVAEQQLLKTDDARIEIMRRSEIERLEADYAVKKSRIEKSAEIADILTVCIARGVIRVDES